MYIKKILEIHLKQELNKSNCVENLQVVNLNVSLYISMFYDKTISLRNFKEVLGFIF